MKTKIQNLHAQLNQIETRTRKPPKTKWTRDLLFKGLDGEFHDEGEPDEGEIYNCGDSDCGHGWHKDSMFVDQGRLDGKEWYIVYHDTIAGCGDYQPIAGWDEREGDVVDQSILDDLQQTLERRVDDILISQARYALHVAETGKDPLGEWFKVDPYPEEALRDAEHTIELLNK